MAILPTNSQKSSEKQDLGDFLDILTTENDTWGDIDTPKGDKSARKSTNAPKKATWVRKKTKPKAKPKPTRKKYNWDAMKVEFMQSDFLDVSPYIRRKTGQEVWNNKWIAEKTKGWWAEKKKLMEEAQRVAMEKFKMDLRKEWTEAFDKMEMAHVQWVRDLANMILDQWKTVKRKREVKGYYDKEMEQWIGWSIEEHEEVVPYMDQAQIINVIKHFKLEKWQPTDIVETGAKSLAKSWLDDLKTKKENKPNELETTENENGGGKTEQKESIETTTQNTIDQDDAVEL